MFNVPVESLRRRVNGDIPIECRPGPKPILTVDEEAAIARYCMKMAEMGFGLGRDDVLRVGFRVAEKSGRPHPWDPDSGVAGRAWFEGFMSRHPTLKLKAPQPLSHACYFWRKWENTHNPNMYFSIRAGNSSDDDFSKGAFD